MNNNINNSVIDEQFIMDKNKEINSVGEIITEIGYTTSGNIAKAPPIVDVDDEKCYAKKVVTENHEKFYIKGTRSGDLFNPFDSMESDRQKRLMGKIGDGGYTFVSISDVGFRNYLEFLRSNNSLYYTRAVRELKQF
jgi:hypothetical protein